METNEPTAPTSPEITTEEAETDEPIPMPSLKRSAQFSDAVESPAPETSSTEEPKAEPQVVDNQQVTESPVNENASTPTTETPVQQPENDFVEVWKKMLEIVFAKVPAVLFPLKTVVPKIENNIVDVPVMSQIQADYFTSKQGESLEFMRQNFSSSLTEIRVTITAEAKTEKLIYTNEEKLAYFKESNAELQEFMQILNLRGNF